MKVSSSRFSVFSFSRFLVFTLAAALFITQASAQVVEIPDPNLETAIREALELPNDAPLTQHEMEILVELSARKSDITDLTGLEHATSLRNLHLCGNRIRDVRTTLRLGSLEKLNALCESDLRHFAAGKSNHLEIT